MKVALRQTATRCWLMLSLSCGPALAADYFKPYSADGSVRREPCSQLSGPGAVRRDLGEGVTVEVQISGEHGKPLSVALLFRSVEDGLRLAPEGIRLHVFPGGMVTGPSTIRRAAYRPAGESCDPYGEWLHLTFPAQPGSVEQVALAFDADALATRALVRVNPFRFERTDVSAAESGTPVRPAITMEALRPSARPRHALARTPAGLKGVWVIDAAGTEELLKKAGRPKGRESGYAGAMIGFWFVGILTFDDHTLTLRYLANYRGTGTPRYRLVSSENGKAEYVREGHARADEEEALTVTFLGQESIHVRSSRPTWIHCCAWQRGQPMSESEERDAARRAVEQYQAMMQNLERAWPR